MQVTYKELLQVFWRHIDPTDSGGQFVDRGSQCRTAVFYHNEEQKKEAEESKAELAKSGRFKKPVITDILPFTVRKERQTCSRTGLNRQAQDTASIRHP